MLSLIDGERDLRALAASLGRSEFDTAKTLFGLQSAGLIRYRRGLIQIVQRSGAGQREVSYGTTPRFLEWFGLQTLEDLPRTQDLQQL